MDHDDVPRYFIMTLLIGLTGGIGSGKSTVASLFKEKGITIVDADVVAREQVEPSTETFARIVAHFGEEILNPDGTLHRSALRECIFNHPQERLWLNALLHPLIREDLFQQAKASQSPYTLLVIPLLIESLPYPHLQRILVVDTPLALQLERTMKRDQISLEAAQKILSHQISREERLKHADDVIVNDKTLSVLKSEIDELHSFYLSLIQS